MKCKVCGKELNDNKAQCPVCGFRVLQIPAGEKMEEAEEKILLLAKEYREHKLSGTKIKMILYEQDQRTDQKRLNVEHILELAECSHLSTGQVIWVDQKFARMERKEPLTIRLIIEKKDGTLCKKQVSIQAPSTSGAWTLGILMQEEFRIRILLRDDKEETRSNPLSLADVF